ncbi:hypothetical protein M917_0776 [Psychrobacter aquaticus CMS 56]|uniref:Uncharacterized protein n=1 Tax=Psychrobacter aquaticus CMS 56 TaxID=1354303 RepID=U4TCB3_9GAMM|nr:hypothetical protein M917_0776 [Psychrobacter aquaticus CMS 56]
MRHYKAKTVALGEELSADISVLNESLRSYKLTIMADD